MFVARQAILCPKTRMNAMTMEQMECMYNQAPHMYVIMTTVYGNGLDLITGPCMNMWSPTHARVA